MKLFKTKGQRKRFFKYGFRLMNLEIWKSEYVAARLVQRRQMKKYINRSVKQNPQYELVLTTELP